MTTPTAALTTARLDQLVDDVRAAVGRGLPPDTTAYLVGERLAGHLGAPDLLTDEQREGDPDRYRQHILHAESDGSFSVVALVWLPGQQTSVHDHVSWCVTGVHEGQESERRYRLVPDGTTARLVATEDVVNGQGDVCGFAPPGDIHRVRNSCSSKAISIHIYGADVARLGSSVRRVYDLPVGEL
ncbi:putative metal-dependent enzyme of the double-stranded beta helix superfamily protein [Streptomyces netropsis]|uniref:Metal-dependent enzyme (Double-stranded beta helix superfamily) n=1 Tax=Streptomyces syringium TaxID=76729 RepID=A0ABS4Y2W2_9ACTN|nr:cysteine dioxygenase family protein [Streptomyces syringium]MBP2403117.1 putative metal-dependent enzyme (double-stranded beta helix superfamily) [Streptomyces syringium]SPE52064.1 putative metal-dependent enzyme of the double-stranded beta helix superfamily protein [Streptomyces netropsis]